MEKIVKFLKENPIFYFATVDGDRPCVRPFGLVFMYEGKLYFGTGKHKAVYAQLMKNPNVEISTCTPDGRLWIRVRGKAVFDDSPEIHEMAFATTPVLQEIYNEKTGFELAAFYLKDVEAELRSIRGDITELV